MVFWLFVGLGFDAVGAEDQVYGAYGQDDERSDLRSDGFGQQAHQRGNDRASADARNHQARNFIGLVRAAAQRQRVDDREDGYPNQVASPL